MVSRYTFYRPRYFFLRSFYANRDSTQPPPLPAFNNPTPEQVFLAKNYDENSKKPDRDPRGAFKNPSENPAAGVVGPMGSSSFNLPNVERALTEMEGAIGGPSSLSMSGGTDARKLPTRTSTRPPSAGLSVSPNTRPQVGSPTLASAPSPPTDQMRHELLQDFFKKLLDGKDRGGTNPASKSATAKPAETGSGSGAEEGA